MRRLFVLVLPLALAAGTAQAQASPALPIPEVKPYVHTGTIDKSYEDEAKSTSVVLAMTLEEGDLDTFTGRSGRISGAHLDAGFVHQGWVMSDYPDVVTLVLKLVHSQPAKQASAAPMSDLVFALDGRQAMTVSAPLVNRSALSDDRKRPRIEDTYVAVMTLNQFLALVNGSAVTATLEKHELTFTGSPLEGLRDLASRMSIVR